MRQDDLRPYVSPKQRDHEEAREKQARQVREFLRSSTPLTKRDGRFRRDPFTGRLLEYL